MFKHYSKPITTLAFIGLGFLGVGEVADLGVEAIDILDQLFNGTRMELTPEQNDKIVSILRRSRDV